MQPHRSRPYNLHIAGAFYRAGYMESWGRGIKKIQETCNEYGTDDISFVVHSGDFMIILPALKAGLADKFDEISNGALSGALNDNNQKTINLIVQNPNISQYNMSDVTGLKRRQIQRILKKLMEATAMILYHGSNIADIKILKPHQADHDRPYVYMTTIDVVAAFYLCNAVEKPYYWFPYGFEYDSNVPIYNELYPNALKEVSEGVSGYIYEVRAEECQVIPFKNIPCARLATEPVAVTGSVIADAQFMHIIKRPALYRF